jgi:cathepsin B
MKLVIVALLVALAAAIPLINDQERIQYINAHANWQATAYEMFDGVSEADSHHFLGLLKRPRDYLNFPLIDVKVDANLPDAFDARTQWPGRIIAIRDQKSCGSCWAFGATEALSDVFNVAHKEITPIILSPQQLVSCDTTSYGCQGGYPDKAWNYMEKGVVLDTCYPYTSGGGSTGTCLLAGGPKAGAACPSTGTGKQVVYHAAKTGRLPAQETAIAQYMFDHGPIEMGFHVYSDFMNYKSGVYHHVSGSLQGGHAIKCLGWGLDSASGLKYWICANSWGTGWGMQGYFWIKKGSDECGIESWFTVGGEAGKIDE